ncbi:MAG TPA: hypothetical protein VNT76_15875, partial [Candidatus Binatus sp.]|nr:hypothetical protein [Candidatus Binatus sp.]
MSTNSLGAPATELQPANKNLTAFIEGQVTGRGPITAEIRRSRESRSVSNAPLHIYHAVAKNLRRARSHGFVAP